MKKITLLKNIVIAPFTVLKTLINKIASELEKTPEGLMLMVAFLVFMAASFATAVLGGIGSFLFSYEYTIMNSIITFIVFMVVGSYIASLMRDYGFTKENN